ncbi:Gfo/Idh/MocA family oxidoreductase [Paenibacillus sp.]|uniref:Gfo/Idh/MocA family protein n=1 Tax=Paenibacillus sp. TaxID=58172 RepID=UPI002D3444DF|nr:Gfo/Idh/MocA family oxidoreductase [Paenibacillus sp.]HZG58647.1 Gfo/Idh/MocA family oxidoreductase [Paenibacillus sp.]
MSRPLGFGIVGNGTIAEYHARAILELPGARFVGAAGRSPDKVAAFVRRLSAEVAADAAPQHFANADALLASPDVDVVCVATSSGSHAMYAEAALEAGKHVVVEKPMAMTSADADRLIALAARRGRTLSVISQRRFEAPYALAKRMLDEGRLGRLLVVEAHTPFYRTQAYYDSAVWRGTIAEDGGALMNQGIHQIDLMLWYGGPASAVSGKIATMTHEMEAEDVGAALVTFAGGALGVLTASTSLAPGFPPTVKLFGERGAIWLEGNAVVHWSVPGVERPPAPESASIEGGNDPKAFTHENHRRQLEDVLDAIAAGRPPLLRGEDGRATVRLIEAIVESSETGREVRLDG